MRKAWDEKIFDMDNQPDKDLPIKRQHLADPDHPICKLILYIYSMESFVYAELNKVQRELKFKNMLIYIDKAQRVGNIEKASTLGPFDYCLT
jgi:hypothetical protein